MKTLPPTLSLPLRPHLRFVERWGARALKLTPHARKGARRLAAVLVSGLIVACGNHEPVGPGPSVGGGMASQLHVTGQPQATLDGREFARPLIVDALDSLGHATGDGVSVTVTVGRGSATLSGTTSRTTSNGRATFDDLVLTGTGPVTLRASAAGLAPDSANPIEVVSAVPPSRSWSIVRPRVLRVDQSDSIDVTLVLSAPATAVMLQPSSGAPAIRLLSVAPYVYTARISSNLALSSAAHPSGDQHAFIGFLDVYQGSTRELRYNLLANVRGAEMPDVAVGSLSPTAQISDHVLNLRWDTLVNGGGPSPSILREVYRWVPDDFDFIAVIEQVETFANRGYLGVRNNTTGIGATLFDRGAAWGSAARLQGVIAFPISTFFDGASVGMSHELGHRWMVYVPTVASGAHWRVSDLAYGIMGFSLPGGVGGEFPYTITDLGSTGVRFDCTTRARDFNRAELYLMGLLPPDSVTDTFLVIDDPPPTITCGTVYNGAVRRITVDSMIAAAGGERPLETNREYRLGVVVLSAGALLTPNEMAYFDAMAARAEAEVELPGSEGLARYLMRPFFLATGGRARLVTRMR